MDDLIIRTLSGSASRFELERLRRWREASPENEQLFQENARVWSLTAPEPVATSARPPALEIITGSESPLTRERPAAVTGRGGRGTGVVSWPQLRRWGLLAASVAAVAFGVRLFGDRAPAPLSTYVAPQGETLTVSLEDGSYVRLAGGSRLDEWSLDGAREVTLAGRAFFAVARDEARPFIVRTAQGEIRVLGTRFEVSEPESGQGAVRVVVVEGQVSVVNELGAVVVSAGSVARMAQASAPEADFVEDVWALLDWPDGVLVFHATPLAMVAQEIARHFQRPLSVNAESLRGRRITAWFQTDPFEDVVESLCIVVEASCRETGEGVAMELGAGGVR